MSRNIHVIYKASCNTGTGDINEKRVIILNEKNISKIYLRKMFSYMQLQWLIKGGKYHFFARWSLVYIIYTR